MHSSTRSLTGNLANELGGNATAKSAYADTGTTGLYDLWLNSMLPAVGSSMVTGVTSSSSHQIDSERLAGKLIQLCISETHGEAPRRRVAGEGF